MHFELKHWENVVCARQSKSVEQLDLNGSFTGFELAKFSSAKTLKQKNITKIPHNLRRSIFSVVVHFRNVNISSSVFCLGRPSNELICDVLKTSSI